MTSSLLATFCVLFFAFTLFVLMSAGALQAQVAAQAPADFAHNIVPIVKKHCGRCHTAGQSEGGVAFNTRDELIESGIVNLQNPADSELLFRITSDDPEVRMPPDGPALESVETQLLQNWIAEGAPWEPGFSFATMAVQRPMQLRSVEIDYDSPVHPIDQILSTELTAVHWEWLVSNRAFYRRASLDLVGLLPPVSELEDFAKSEESDRRSRLVDRILDDSVAYADHWLTFWNDLLRNDYRGTGYIDGGRKSITAWLYQSLRDNKPYDVMVSELIIPSAESEGFALGIRWRGNVNASQIPELQFAQNVGQVFLGVNLKCASCHDSFIDHWKLRDAYSLAAVIAEAPLQLHRCDVPQNETATAAFLFSELGEIDAVADRQQRLEQLAQLITTRENGRFARTIVNRLWQRMMGRALVEPVDSMDAPAWNEDLLDWLAADFIAHGYDLRHTLTVIAKSNAYAMRSAAPPAPGESFEFAGPIPRRLTAEQWLDSVAAVTGSFPGELAAEFGDRGGYPVRAALTNATPLMRELGRPNREQVVTSRPQTLTTLEAIELINGPETAALVEAGATQLIAQHQEPRALIEHLYLAALSRIPTDQEREIASSYLSTPLSTSEVSDLIWSVIMQPEFYFVR